MAEQILLQAGPETELLVPRADPSKLHLVSGKDAIEAASPDARLDAILARGDIRDQAAERRDRRAEHRFPVGTAVTQERIATRAGRGS